MRSTIYSLLARYAEIRELIKSTVLEFRTAVASTRKSRLFNAFKNYQISTVLTYMMMLASVLVGTCGIEATEMRSFLCDFISLPIVDLSFQVHDDRSLSNTIFYPLFGMICLSEKKVRCKFLFDLCMIINLFMK